MRNNKCKHASKKFVALATALFLGVGMISSQIVSNAQEATSTEVATQTDALSEDTQTVMAGEIPAGAVALDAEHFPDENFRRDLQGAYDKDGKGYIFIADVKHIYLEDMYDEIHSLIGIEYFTELETFSGGIHVIEEKVDFGNNKKLTSLSGNFEDVDFSECLELQSIGIYYTKNNNDITLDIRSMSKLKKLSVNNVRNIVATGNKNIESISICGNLKSIDIEGCSGLKELDLEYSWNRRELEELNIAGCDNLETLICGNCKISKFDINGFTKLKTVDLSHNYLNQCTISNCPDLNSLNVFSNQLTSVNVNGCPDLKFLNVSSNQLTTVNIDNCPNIENLFVDNNRIANIDVKKYKNLRKLDCGYNELSSLDVSSNTQLEDLYCFDNRLTELNIDNNIILKTLHCSENNISKINLSNNTKLERLYCNHNRITELDMRKCVVTSLAADYEPGTTIYFSSKQPTGMELYMKELDGLLDLSGLVGLDCSKVTDQGYDRENNRIQYLPTYDMYVGNCYSVEGVRWHLYGDSVALITPSVSVSYATHIQTLGDSQGFKKDGQMAGTSGMAKRLENIKISVSGNKNLGIQYSTHCQTYGWLPWSTNGEANGTSGEAKRLEAIKIQLTGADKSEYDVYYRVHAQSYGWLGWAKNGEPSGTAGYGKRLEGIQIVVKKKGETAPGLDDADVKASAGVHNDKAYIAKTAGTIEIPGNADAPNVMYKTHVQSIGWQKWMTNGQMSGTSGMAKRLEGINVKLSNCPYTGGIRYATHIQTYGWSQGWKADGAMAGTSGEAKRLEAIKIELTGEMAKHYDVYYRVHAQSYGWLGWAKNGEESGTAGLAKRLEGIQIVLVPKGQAAPGDTYLGITNKNPKPFISK